MKHITTWIFFHFIIYNFLLRRKYLNPFLSFLEDYFEYIMETNKIYK